MSEVQDNQPRVRPLGPGDSPEGFHRESAFGSFEGY